MKRYLILFCLGLFVLVATTGCWSIRYDNASDNDYYYYPSHPNVDYINLLAPQAEAPKAPVGQ